MPIWLYSGTAWVEPERNNLSNTERNCMLHTVTKILQNSTTIIDSKVM